MALTRSERVKRWRDNNRALHNLRRRAYRKKNLSGGERQSAESAVTDSRPTEGEACPPSQLPLEITVSKGKFPRMVSLDGPPVEAEKSPPMVYRNDFGTVITQGQWEKLQQLKQRAATGGYVIDEYSQ